MPRRSALHGAKRHDTVAGREKRSRRDARRAPSARAAPEVVLLKRARAQTGKGVTATIRGGLELVAAGQVYDRLRALRGKVAFTIDPRALRKDRR